MPCTCTQVKITLSVHLAVVGRKTLLADERLIRGHILVVQMRLVAVGRVHEHRHLLVVVLEHDADHLLAEVVFRLHVRQHVFAAAVRHRRVEAIAVQPLDADICGTWWRVHSAVRVRNRFRYGVLRVPTCRARKRTVAKVAVVKP